MASKIYSSRLLIQQAAKALDNEHQEKTVLAAMAKKCNLYMSIYYLKYQM